MFVESTTYGKIKMARNDISSISSSLTNSSIKEINMAKSNLPNKQFIIKTCGAFSCERIAVSKGYCDKHYRRLLRHGTTLLIKTPRPKRATRESFEKRFWSYIDKTSNLQGCWEWTGRTNFGGYGRINWDGKKILAHRVAWMLAYGKEPTTFLLHSCDNPKCVNTDHLREGTHQDNAKDRVERNRQPKGSNVANAKLTESEVLKIRDLLAEKKLTQTKIGEMFGVKRKTIVKIKARLTWKHLESTKG